MRRRPSTTKPDLVIAVAITAYVFIMFGMYALGRMEIKVPVIDSVDLAAVLSEAEQNVNLGKLYANGGDTRNARLQLERSHALMDLARKYVVDRGGIIIVRKTKYDQIVAETIKLRTRVLKMEAQPTQPIEDPDPLTFDTPSEETEDVR